MTIADEASVVSAALTLADLADGARRRLSAQIREFVEGGTAEKHTVVTNLDAFAGVRLQPYVLSGVGRPATATEILGRTWAAPIGVAPLAYQTLVRPEGELATVGAAGSMGLPVVVSALAGQPLEAIAEVATGPLWFQLYCFQDRSLTRRLAERAEQAGYEALVLTANPPRPRPGGGDPRNGFHPPVGAAAVNLGHGSLPSFDLAAGWDQVQWLRGITRLPVLVKGVMASADAELAVGAGAAGVIVSNHGGRPDGTTATLDALPRIAEAVAGRCAVLLDGGVRRGTDVLAALALGADAVLLGRPVLHGLAVGGAQGVERALDIVTGELAQAMALAGVNSTDSIRPDLVLGPHPRLTASHVQAPARPCRRGGARPAARLPGSPLVKSDLHSSLSDPVLDTMNFLNEVTRQYPQAISFAPGRPYDGFFDVEQVFDHIRRYLDHLRDQGSTPAEIRDALFQYGPTAGRIREIIADSLRLDEGIDVAPESVVVTVGAQEAMFLALRALHAAPEDVLLVSSPCYVGISGAAGLLGIPLVPVPERPDGFHSADFEAAVHAARARGARPRALYVVPDHSNPLGTTMPEATRRELLEVADRLGVLIIEDSPYRLVSPGHRLPTLKSLDQRRTVVHLGSFSKSLFPGARVGFAVADQTVDDNGRISLLADELSKIKSMISVNTSPLSQAVVAGMLLSGGGSAAALNAQPSEHYGAAMRATQRELERRFPLDRRGGLGVQWNKPSGGFFLALTVPFAADDDALIRSAQDHGVIWTPMSYFHPGGGGSNQIRLSVSYLSEEQIREGVARLAAFVESETTNQRIGVLR